MKGFFVICALALVVCLWQGVQGSEHGCTIYGKHVKVGQHVDHNCARYTCTAPGQFGGVTCPEVRCVKQIGYKERDLTKPYPECCERPICKE